MQFIFTCEKGNHDITFDKKEVKLLKQTSLKVIAVNLRTEEVNKKTGVFGLGTTEHSLYGIHDHQKALFEQFYFVCPLDGEKIFIGQEKLAKRGAIVEKNIRKLLMRCEC